MSVAIDPAAIALSAALAYLLGSIPCGVLLTRMAGFGDIRRIGSGNIGATNVLRTGNKMLALLTLLGDAGKGAVAVLLVRYLWPDPPALAALAMLVAVLGHMFPVWLRFRGGKSMATTLGALAALSWPAGLAAAATWLLVAVLFRYSSLASLVAVGIAPLFAWVFAGPSPAAMTAAVTVFVWARHHENIVRLLGGAEPKITGKA